MKVKSSILLVMALGLVMSSCKMEKTHILWVSGYKQIEQVEGASDYVAINKSEDLKNQEWVMPTKEIEGLPFEEGFMKKIEVEDGADSLTYIFVKELDKKTDPRLALNKAWVLETINGEIPDSLVKLPTLNFDLYNARIFGSGGCNQFSAPLLTLTTENLEIGNAAATLMACIDKNSIEDTYFGTLFQAKSFKVEDGQLIILDVDGKEILTFKEDQMHVFKNILGGEWKVESINGEELAVVEKTPTLNFDFDEMRVYGTDGCNNYFGQLKNIDENGLNLGMLASTKKMCENMTVPDAYNKAINAVVLYRIENNVLMLMDEDGETILTFNRGE